MATARKINLSTEDSGIFHSNPRADSASTASTLLQKDMESHHIFFNDSGFHNHTVHHILSIFALGANPEYIQQAYNRAANYQRPALPFNEDILQRLRNEDAFRSMLGKRQNYPHFLEFFQRELESSGVQDTVNKYIFSGSDFADDMLARTLGGLLHPFIHLGFGLEFKQPAIVAQALAQAAVHEASLKEFLLASEQRAGGVGCDGSKTLVQLQNETRADAKLRDSAHWTDENKIFDGVLNRAPANMINIASQFTVSSNQMDKRLAELLNAVVYYTGTAQNPPKKVKFDFFYIHCVNSAIFLPVFLSAPWLSLHNKLRLMEWKGRMDLLVYVSRHCPEPLIDEIQNYATNRSWQEIYASCFHNEQEDGHAAKLVRLLAYSEKLCKPYENADGFKILGDMWLKLGNMVADSIEGPEQLWVRSTGFPEAWKDIPERRQL